MRCIAPGCTSGYDTNHEKVHFFNVPKNEEQKKAWQAAIRRTDIKLKCSQALCEHHFKKDDILRKRKLYGPDKTVIGISPYKIPRLAKGAIPSIFPWVENMENQQSVANISAANTATIEKIVPSLHSEDKLEDSPKNICADDPLKQRHVEETACFKFSDLCEQSSVCLPVSWIMQVHTKVITFFTSSCINTGTLVRTVTMKEVILHEDMTIQINVIGQKIDPSTLRLPKTPICSMQALQDILFTIDGLNICSGYLIQKNTGIENLQCEVVRKDDSGTWRHVNCCLMLFDTAQCEFCAKLKKTIERKRRRQEQRGSPKKIRLSLSPRKQGILQKLRNKKYTVTKASKRKTEIIKKLQFRLQECETKLTEVNEQTLEEAMKMKEVPKHQQDAVREILAAAKCKNSKGRKYSEDWILLSLLMHMRSPCGYEFLRNNNILPLPCARTVRRYLSIVDTTCGFDDKFFETYEALLTQKSSLHRHGLLLIDEISTRESISVKSSNLTYKGLVDFGLEEMQSSDLSDKANHALVFMYQPLIENCAQPIGVFASRGPVPGVTIAKLVIKAIVKLEKIGAKVHGIISDGAAPNRKFWTEMGVSGVKDDVKNYFAHPTINGRRVYVFSDTPHLIKTIRNRLHNKSTLQMDPQKKMIKWRDLQIMYEKDKMLPGKLRVCPKLTANHLELSNSAKMRVRLAVQVFSKSVAQGLRFYSHHIPDLEDCEETALFCEWINDLFDSLNRKMPAQGLKVGNSDYKVLEDSLQKLDSWEQKVQDKLLPEKFFLTKQTAEGLRVTIRSVLDLTQYLTQKCGFSHVLTGRINQDPLERFFGTVRQAGGPNDHPGTPTFLQIYKILSLYSVLKPPKAGNCTILENGFNDPPISISQLKAIYEKPESSQSTLEIIKEKLDAAIVHEDWVLDDVVEQDHDYCSPVLTDCVLYYVTGYVSRQITKYVNCEICKSAFISPTAHSTHPAARLTNCKSQGYLLHPNKRCFRFIQELESRFQRHCQSGAVLELVLDDILQEVSLTFPCKDHMHDIIPRIIQYYILMRMRQYSQKENQERKKINQHKKKVSKFSTT